jgi:hypothetical protein
MKDMITSSNATQTPPQCIPTQDIANRDTGGYGKHSFSNLSVKKYIGCKIIAAEPMSEHEFLRTVKGKTDEELSKQETLGDGYKVIYPDNYVSWSPKKVFEDAYREISMQEMSIIHREFYSV